MSQVKKGLLADPSATSEDIRRAFSEAVAQALWEHKRDGDPIAVWDWDNWCVRIVPPEEIVVPDLSEPQDSASTRQEDAAPGPI